MTRDEFINKWSSFNWIELSREEYFEKHAEFAMDLDELLSNYEHSSERIY